MSMREFLSNFLKRGFTALGFGPIVLAVVYLFIERFGGVSYLEIREVSCGIFSLSALAFVVGGMNAIYRVERLSLMVAILIHVSVLYIGYLCTYLLNSWIEWGSGPILVFTLIFAVGYIAIWAVICLVTRKNTKKLNESLKKKQIGFDNLT